jgi:hypothetical protein
MPLMADDAATLRRCRHAAIDAFAGCLLSLLISSLSFSLKADAAMLLLIAFDIDITPLRFSLLPATATLSFALSAPCHYFASAISWLSLLLFFDYY